VGHCISESGTVLAIPSVKRLARTAILRPSNVAGFFRIIGKAETLLPAHRERRLIIVGLEGCGGCRSKQEPFSIGLSRRP
jgi:hypothetical protein